MNIEVERCADVGMTENKIRRFSYYKAKNKHFSHYIGATNLFAGLIAYNLLPKKSEMNTEIIDKSKLIAKTYIELTSYYYFPVIVEQLL